MSCRIRFGGATDPANELVGNTCGGSFLAQKTVRGGNRAWGPHPQPIKNKVDTVDTALRRLTDTMLEPERGIVRFANFRFWRYSGHRPTIRRNRLRCF
jgi:hypothetical protein